MNPNPNLNSRNRNATKKNIKIGIIIANHVKTSVAKTTTRGRIAMLKVPWLMLKARKRSKKKNLIKRNAETTKTKSQWKSLNVNSKLTNLSILKITTLQVMSNLLEVSEIPSAVRKEITMYLEAAIEVATGTIIAVVIAKIIVADAAVVIAPLVNTIKSDVKRIKTNMPVLITKRNPRMNRKEKVLSKSVRTNVVLNVETVVVVVAATTTTRNVVAVIVKIIVVDAAVVIKSATTTAETTKTTKVKTKRLRETTASKISRDSSALGLEEIRRALRFTSERVAVERMVVKTSPAVAETAGVVKTPALKTLVAPKTPTS